MNKIKTLLKYLLLVLVLFFIVKKITSSYQEIKEFDFGHLNYYYLTLATICLIYANIFPVFAWKYLLGCLGGEISAKRAMRTWFVANAGRYLPGKVWQIAGIVYLCEQEGISRKISLQSMIYSQFTASYLGLLFLFVLFRDMLATKIGGIYPDLIFYAVLAASLVIFIPGILKGGLNYLLTLLRKSPLEHDLSFRQILSYVFLQLVNWLNIGLTFYLFVLAFKSLSLQQHPQIVFILPAAWTVGLLAVFVPGGIGVREGVLTMFLGGVTGPALAVVIPWIHRIWATVIEAVFAVVFYCFKKNRPE